LEEYLTKRDKYRRVMSNMSDTALEIFKSWSGFTKHIKAAFEVLNKQQEAELAIIALKQKGSAVAYTREFQR
jgi:hypothetical protein